ncbi:MAG: hypothetical protein Q8922_10645 [Bacteroidota bacterium]|nr:hypothetical protein [Bacteroidota bacterium]MDP4233020.1 hypothetical protein [Bacteroidota bacterium]MDP4288384.1 hypothetical protein [Bacteroidota bacterium]
MFSPSIGPLLYGFALLLLFFVLMNADRRFREHVSRSMLRPFNFFADLRDRRLLPNAQTTLLAVILSGSAALCLGAILRHVYALEATRNAAGQVLPVGLRSWAQSEDGSFFGMVLWLTLIVLTVILFMVLVLRFIAIFRKGRIMIGDTYNVVVWSALPIVVLLPFDLLLPRMDVELKTIILAVSILVVLILWVYYRLLKGAGVLFDVYPARLYIYGTFALLVVTILVLGYLQSLHILSNFR